MAIRVRNKLVDELLSYLDRKAGEGDNQAADLHHELQADQIEATYEDMRESGELPIQRTKGGSYII